MKISRDQLQAYFTAPLPSTAEIADAFTFHCFEIEEVAGDLLDIKVLPNRAADCKSEAGIAGELAAILDIPLKDARPRDFSKLAPVRTSLARINGHLGAHFTQMQVEDVCRRLGFKLEAQGDVLIITPPAERVDVTIPEDIAEEVGRIIGYDHLKPAELPPPASAPDQARYRGIERMKDQLVEQGYIEVSTQSFAEQGDIELANPLDKSRPFLRTSLENNLKGALEKAKQYAPLVLPPGERPKLFEVGTVFPKAGEYMELRMTERVAAWGDAAGISDNLSVAKLEDYGKDYEPVRYELGMYKPFSPYPFVTRDIALWAPIGTDTGAIARMITGAGGELLTRVRQKADDYQKEGRQSYLYQLVFQSEERTLTDTEVNACMGKITAALRAAGYDPR